jgi:lysophospholipase L1-like esterase
MKLFTFGDSWTEGVGGNRKEEYTTDIPEQITIIRQKYSWPSYLAKLLGINVKNSGVGASCNNSIFNFICEHLKSNIIKKNDLVIVMWSSPLRDDLPFFPNENNFTIWGERYKSKKHIYDSVIQNNTINTNLEYLRLNKDFRDYYLNNLFNDSYYHIISQNYILHLQFMFKKLGINYVFCDAFDNLINSSIDKSIDKTNLIDSVRYWGYKKTTFADFLINLKRKDVWEDNNHWIDKTSGKHPNEIGYKLIAEELYDFIIKNNLLKQDSFENLYLI